MRWKVVVGGSKPSRETVRLIAEMTSLLHDEILLSLEDGNLIAGSSLSESEAQKLADHLCRDTTLKCRVLPEKDPSSTSEPSFRVLLVDFRPGYRTRLRRRLQKLTGLSNEQIVIWLSRMPFSLASGVDGDAARQIRKKITEAGGIVRIDPEPATGDRVQLRTRSTAVFQQPAEDRHMRKIEEPVPSSIEAAEQTEKTEPEKESPSPPITGLPSGFSADPPPLDEIDTAYGRVMRSPPLKFLPGQPSPSLRNGFFKSVPPVLKSADESVPSAIVFDLPASLFEIIPDVIGRKDESDPSKSSIPAIVIAFPPASSISRKMLLPPLIDDSKSDDNAHIGNEAPPPIESWKDDTHGFQGSIQSDRASVTSDSLSSDQFLKEQAVNSSAAAPKLPFRLFLYSPPLRSEKDVANALSEVLGLSLDKSLKMLEESPSHLGNNWTDEKAVEIAHQLEKRGVTISLVRKLSVQSTSSGNTRNGFRAWLTSNG